jgi:adenine-specific DNA glycosylase
MEPLKKSDRCDRCNAEAKARIRLKTGELLFCQHHMNEHLDKLMDMGADISTRKEHEVDEMEVAQ